MLKILQIGANYFHFGYLSANLCTCNNKYRVIQNKVFRFFEINRNLSLIGLSLNE